MTQYAVILRDKHSNKIVAEAEYETTKNGTKVNVLIPFPRPSILQVIYNATVLPTVAFGAYCIVKVLSNRSVK
jgi:hypothetical protein